MKTLPASIFRSLPFVLPLCAIALARLMTFSDWATDHSAMAAAIYAWIVADALLLGLLAKAPGNKPTFFQVFGMVSLAVLITLLGASGPLRAVYFGFPELLISAGGTVCLFLAWSGYRIVSEWQKTGSFALGLENVLPAQLARAIISEGQIVWLALIRWGAPVDVPAGQKAFAYHTYLTPMIATFLALQLIELSVVHLLLMLWNPLVAWICFGFSVWGLIWTTALLKSFRIKPVLIGPDAVRVRNGIIYDFEIPMDCISTERNAFTTEELNGKSILNLAILSSPNVSLRFTKPLAIRTFFGRTKEISGVGLRLDESNAFLEELARRRH